MDRVKEQLQKTSPDFNECHTQSQTGPAKPLEKLGQCFFFDVQAYRWGWGDILRDRYGFKNRPPDWRRDLNDCE